MLRSSETITTDDPLEAPMFRYGGMTSWQCGWCPEVCHDAFWVERHREFHRSRLLNLLALNGEQYDGQEA